MVPLQIAMTEALLKRAGRQRKQALAQGFGKPVEVAPIIRTASKKGLNMPQAVDQ